MTTLVVVKNWSWLRALLKPTLFFGSCMIVFYGIYLLMDFLSLDMGLSIRVLIWFTLLAVAFGRRIVNVTVIKGIIKGMGNGRENT